ncbi:MAG TPA: GNAT family N-acetyltransferase [Thermotogota bacterium]|nr:GNAT family N-acetyltransferase [Thermotogota bacterium]
MDVTLQKIGMEEFKECLCLKVDESQTGFVAPNMYSLAEAKVDGVSIPRAVYAGEQMVGFVMFWFDEINGMGYIDRLMVDHRFQGKGYGKKAMQLVIQYLLSQPNCQRIRTSYHPDNAVADKLYASLGFETTGEIDHGEVVAVLDRIQK